ncbi:Esterase FUS5 [Camellia lanceoleosa]|uniref:Esterase FUS5 n=1 Tax=Camellia lanceoleosa TaxID=1840588 RepID=A0ACC0J2K8_9ERIC|nr:Esterase FUS5 [Camellia lanceoleosa]
MEMEYQVGRKPRFLCFHGYRTSGKILERELQQWPEFVREKMELVFIDAPFLAQGPPIPPAVAEGNLDPPYYEWFQSNEDFSEYMNFDECIAYIEDCMTRIGPFDGLLGFSQTNHSEEPRENYDNVKLTDHTRVTHARASNGPGKEGGLC